MILETLRKVAKRKRKVVQPQQAGDQPAPPTPLPALAGANKALKGFEVRGDIANKRIGKLVAGFKALEVSANSAADAVDRIFTSIKAETPESLGAILETLRKVAERKGKVVQPKQVPPPDAPPVQPKPLPRTLLIKNAKGVNTIRSVVGALGGSVAQLVALTARLHPFALAAVAAGTALVYLTKKGQDFGVTLNSLRLLTGTDILGFQGVSYTASRYGAALDDVAKAVESFTKAKAEAQLGEGVSKEFGMLGLDPYEDSLKSMEQIWRKIHAAEKTGDRDEINRVRLLVNRVGVTDKLYLALRRAKSVTEFEPLFRVDEKKLDQVQKAADAWSRAGAAWDALINRIGTFLAPFSQALGTHVATAFENPLLALIGGPVGVGAQAAWDGLDAKTKQALSPSPRNSMLPIFGGMKPQPSPSPTTINNNISPSVTVTSKSDDPMEVGRVVNGVVVAEYEKAFRQSNQAASGDATNRP